MIYLAPSDPELGYFDAEDVIDTRHGLVAVDSDGEWIAHVVEAPCDVCGEAIPEDAVHPLCALHEGSSRDGGRADAWQERYRRDVGR